MCGIAGVVSLTGDPFEAAVVEAMLDSIGHRGPDGRGTHRQQGVALGHVRLSILDPTAAGAQPMGRDGVWIVHNGEVYNYLELADELRSAGEQFQTGTDTEVILAAYRVWGIDAIRRFNGMFAFALWDSARRRLVLARDRLGVKPLYLRRTARSLLFASEVPAFFAARHVDEGDGWQAEPHLGVVREFLTRHRLDNSPATFVRGVVPFPPAHVLVIEDGVERLQRYWGPPVLADDDRPVSRGTDRRRDEALVDEFRECFEAAVRLRLRADVALGTCLSGGLDSSSIVATVAQLLTAGGPSIARNEQAPRLGIHARFPVEGVDESRFAELAARAAGIRLVYTAPRSRPLLESVAPVLRAQGEPYSTASIDAQFGVMSTARDEGLKVLLDGQGADELLGGYQTYLGSRSAALLRAGHAVAAMRESRSQVARGTTSAGGAASLMLRAMLPAGAVEGVRTTWNARYGIVCGGSLAAEPPLERWPEASLQGTGLARRLWHALTVEGLPALLRYEDRNSMAHGIEARVPFLDVNLVELAVRLPDRLRVERGVTKVALRRAMRSRVPAQILDRRDKTGFAVPQGAWLRSGADEIGGFVRQGQLVERGWLEPRIVERVLAGGMLDASRPSDQLWRLFITEAWLRQHWPRRESDGLSTEATTG